ncbi:MAG: glycosyltransferase family 2 protein [Chromatiales bacterium]|nr:glycosyltransferase family 2 protein [Chromatiales bacterium]
MIDLAIVVPTFNEKDNVDELVARLEQALDGIRWEVVFVDDDSPDHTSDRVRELAQAKPHVRCVQRIGRRGLSRAVIEGVLATSAPYVAVMDGDLQHDEALLPRMLEQSRRAGVDIVVGSRYCPGGSAGEWEKSRARMSWLATRLSRLVVTAQLSDPMSGFFMMRRELFQSLVRDLSGEGYKILLDLFATSPRPLNFVELPYTFRSRGAGESKLDSAAVWEFMLLILDKAFGRVVPARFAMFGLVGLSGIAVHFVSLLAAYRWLELEFPVAQTVATFAAMTSNYALNNSFTYRDRRRMGLRFVTGLLTFYAICGVGVIANVGIASLVFARDFTWWLAGAAGALVGVVWNYAISSMVTWDRR